MHFVWNCLFNVPIEVTVRSEDHYGIVIRFLFVAFKGTQEGIEFRISIVSFAVYSRSICVG
ncbi:MAG: hypothetical protein PVI13_13615, partial [Desulfobacterales bacterium]